MNKQSLLAIPPLPEPQNVIPYHLAITTRLMAKKQARKLSLTEKSAKRSSINNKDLKFLSGAQLPNSRRPSYSSPNPAKQMDMSNKRESEVIKNEADLGPNKKNRSLTIEDTPKIFRMRSLAENEHKTMERIRKSVNQESQANKMAADLAESESRRSRISKRSTIFELENFENMRRVAAETQQPEGLLSKTRRSTLEDIRDAIKNSPQIQKLIDADEIDRVTTTMVHKADPQRDSLLQLVQTIHDRRSSSTKSIKSRGSRRTSHVKRDSETQTTADLEEVRRQLLAVRAAKINKAPLLN